MSGLIDYSARRGNRRSPTASSEEEAATGNANPFSDTTATSTQQYHNRGAPIPSSTSNAGETGYDGYTETDSAPYGKDGGRGGRDVDVADVPTETVDRNDDYRRHVQDENGVFFDPSFPSYEQEEPLEMPFFDHVVQNYPTMGVIGRSRLFFRQSVAFGLSLAGLGLVLVCAFASYFNPLKKSPPKAKPDREYERRITGERLSGRPEYYSEFWGYHCDTHDIVTEGGWILKAHRVSDPRRAGPPGHPVVLQHGILCNSSHFFVNEERSMAFWLVDQGYDVWVTNIRANFGAGHTEFSRNSPQFWAWGLKELAYDLRDVVEFVCGATGKPRLAYVAHSQGTASMFLALSPGICPELGHRLSCFVAFGPSVYAGPVLRKFPFSLLRTFRSRKWWSLVFGVKEFIKAIGLFQQYLPAYIFGHLGYVIFAYLFSFHDHNFVNRQKPKIFRTVPVPTSSELLYWYMASFSHRGCVFDPRITQPWFPKSFPPLSIIYGDLDMLVLGQPLVDRIERYESNVKVVHSVKIENYEHLDFVFAADARLTTFPVIRDTIEATLHETERAPEMVEDRR